MNFDLNDEQKMLGEQARALLADMTPFDRLRTLIDSDAQWDEPLWRKLAEMGFLGVTISEEHGGLGLGALDLGVIMEALGGANAAVPFMSSIVLAAEAIHLAGSKAQQAKWLPKLASGEAIATFAHAEGPGPVFATGTRLENGKLNGSKTPVADAEIADIAVVLVADGGLALVELQQSAVTRTRLESFDQLRPHYRIDFADAVAEPMPGTGKLDRLIDQAAVQAAFEAVGAADACLMMARDYANDRQIFGRPLGGYQAIKHKLADMYVKNEVARSNAYYGAWALSSNASELPEAAAAARVAASEAFWYASKENIQTHGGMGFTWEVDCHLFYRRAKLLAVQAGSPAVWKEKLVSALEAKND